MSIVTPPIAIRVYVDKIVPYGNFGIHRTLDYDVVDLDLEPIQGAGEKRLYVIGTSENIRDVSASTPSLEAARAAFRLLSL